MIRAAVIPAPLSPIEVRSFPEPMLGPGAVLIKTLASEVCGTDVHLWHGRLAGVPYPLIPGHISVGEVVATNGSVTDINGDAVVPGEAVTFLDVHGTCYNCWYCLVAKQSTRCPHRRVYGITYGADDGLLGGWSEQIYLKPGVKLVKLRGGVTPELWIAGGCGLPTALHAIDLAKIQIGDRVLIQGAGPVGLSACALAAASGASWVGVIDAVPHRLEAAKKMGADALIPLDDNVLSAVHRATGGRGADVVIEASGSPSAVPQGCGLARDGGRYIIVGQYSDNGPAEINPHWDINRKHLTVQGCWGVDFSHVWRAMDVLDQFGNRFAWTDIISRRYSLEQAGAALAAVESREVVKALIVP
ncbi:MAG: zinc-binding dehydrogenase [Janthinobacterium lividum]